MGLQKYAVPASTQIQRVCITFDDGFLGVIDYAYPYMAARGIKGTVYATKNFIDTAGYMTSANLTTLYNAGWDIGNHSTTHANYTTLTQAQIETELSTCTAWLNGLGFTRSAKHCAYPSGGYDADTEAAMVAQGMTSGRITGASAGFNYKAGIAGITQILCQDTGRTWSTTLAAALATSSVKNNLHIFLWHSLLDPGPVTQDYEMLASDFYLAIDMIVARRMTTVSISELYPMLV